MYANDYFKDLQKQKNLQEENKDEAIKNRKEQLETIKQNFLNRFN